MFEMEIPEDEVLSSFSGQTMVDSQFVGKVSEFCFKSVGVFF